jgi:AraC-like DNA-binding protein
MLHDSTLSLKEIAAKTGFKTIQHMTTVVTRAFGHSPAEYRRLITSGGNLAAQS